MNLLVYLVVRALATMSEGSLYRVYTSLTQFLFVAIHVQYHSS